MCPLADDQQSDVVSLHLQDPELTVWYGPDTYMGSNLAQLFLSLAQLPDEEVKLVHPGAHGWLPHLLLHLLVSWPTPAPTLCL